jgi:hypothetical protein
MNTCVNRSHSPVRRLEYHLKQNNNYLPTRHCVNVEALGPNQTDPSRPFTSNLRKPQTLMPRSTRVLPPTSPRAKSPMLFFLLYRYRDEGKKKENNEGKKYHYSIISSLLGNRIVSAALDPAVYLF